MIDDRTAPPASLPWWRKLDQVKLTPLVALAFFAALAVMCGGAALVGYTVHHLARVGTHAAPN